jgi:hypothetical protein
MTSPTPGSDHIAAQNYPLRRHSFRLKTNADNLQLKRESCHQSGHIAALNLPDHLAALNLTAAKTLGRSSLHFLIGRLL